VDSVSRGGFRRYRVVRKTVESDVITSFEIVPADGSALARYEPGQFLTFQVDPGDETAGTRHYRSFGSPAWADVEPLARRCRGRR
jgi:nitric oxide dioxygenase